VPLRLLTGALLAPVLASAALLMGATLALTWLLAKE
jgi:hypothetical protein